MDVNSKTEDIDEPDKRWFSNLYAFMQRYCDVVIDGLHKRWDKFDIEIYGTETYEVIGALLARQATLTTQLALAPPIWNGHIAPLILRTMVDAHITLAWILKSPEERANKYILYGLGQEKLFIEHLKREQQHEEDEQLKQIIEGKEAWLNSQRRDFLTEVNVGSWSGINTRDMAKEADSESFYKFAYMPFSGPTHNMWPHVSAYNLVKCRNPLHKYHNVPAIIQVPSDPVYVFMSVEYIHRSYKLFDETYNISVETPMPYDWYTEEFEKLMKKDERDNVSEKT